MKQDIITLKIFEGGTFLGADSEGNIYDGIAVQVAHDELTVEVFITDEGYASRTFYGEHTLNEGYVTKEGFIADRQNAADALAAKDGQPTAEEILETWWQAELTSVQGPHSKAFYDMPPGFDAVEKKYDLIDWKAR